jgi:hypothetical protein
LAIAAAPWPRRRCLSVQYTPELGRPTVSVKSPRVFSVTLAPRSPRLTLAPCLERLIETRGPMPNRWAFASGGVASLSQREDKDRCD